MKNKKIYYQKRDPYSSHMVIGKTLTVYGKDNMKILDLGCDVGFLGNTLRSLDRKFIVHGVDINKQNLKIAGKHYDKTFMFDLNSPSWPINGKYDLVVLADTIEHLYNPIQALNNIYKVLKKDGILIISVPNIIFWWSRLQILLGKFPKDDRGIFDKTHLHFFTRKTLSDLLISQKFKLKSFHTTTFPIQFVFKVKDQNWFFSILYNLNYALSKIWPNMFSYQLIFVVSKI